MTLVPKALPVSPFDAERRRFLASTLWMLDDPAIDPAVKAEDIEATISALRQMAEVSRG